MAMLFFFLGALLCVTQTEGTTCEITSHDDHVTASCSGLLLTSIPPSLPDNVTRLNLSHNRISNLSNLTFRRFQQLQVLDLSDNALSSDLDVDVFVHLDKLEVLDLSHNNITTFSCRHTTVGASKGVSAAGDSSARQRLSLKNLRVLYLDDNDLTAICFSGFNSLVNLSLAHNRLDALPGDTFKELTQLETLNLTANHLQRLDSRSFNGLTNLKTLSLAFNKLQYTNTSFPPDVFAAPGDTLTSLYLHGNDNDRITDGAYPEAAFISLSTLETLKVDSFPSTNFGDGFSAMHNLTTLDLSHECRLRRLHNQTFVSLTNVSLHTLILSPCPSLLTLSTCVFCPLSKLSNLKLALRVRRGLDLSDVLQTFHGFQSRNYISSANLDRVSEYPPRGVSLDRESMKYVLDTCVGYLSLRHNRITSIERLGLGWKGRRFNECIRKIDLSHNMIYYVQIFSGLQFLAYSSRLESINWQFQTLFDPLGASYNHQKAVKKHPHPLSGMTITLASSLSFANMSGAFKLQNSFPSSLVFKGAENLRTFDLSYIRLYNCTTTFEGLDRLERLNISGNDCRTTKETFFDAFPRLKALSLQRMNFDRIFFLTRAARMFNNLTDLKFLDLSFNDFDLLPSDLLRTQTGLQELLLAGNRLGRLSVDVHHHGNLTVLDLSDNDLSQLNDTERASLDAVVAKQSQPIQLRLHGNPLACTCNTLSFVRWLRFTRVHLDRDGDYPCMADDDHLTSTGAVADHWESAWRRCVGPTMLQAAVVMMLLLLLLTGATWGVSAKCLRLRFFFQLLRRVQMPRRQQFLKDLYVAYGDADLEFVCTRLKPELQERRGVHLLIKDLPRDEDGTQFWQLPGDNMAEKMLGHIDLCWKVLLVITPALQRDPMAGFMTRAVLQSITDRMPDRVLLLCVGVRHVPALASLRAVLDSVSENQVFFVPEEADQRHPVWNRMADIILT